MADTKIGMTTSALAIASLFSTCIQCFDYFKATQFLEHDSDVLLVNLDIERTRLLIWGDDFGILKPRDTDGTHPLDNDCRTPAIEKCLRSIQCLLTNAYELQVNYGVEAMTQVEALFEKSRCLVSANSMSTFRSFYYRFWARSNEVQGRPRFNSCTTWVVRDKTKFEALICCLRCLVNDLNVIRPVRSNVQMNVIEDDIASIKDLSSLRLVQIACEKTYPEWSAKASAVIEASENGTVCHRNVEEWLQDRSPIGETGDMTLRDRHDPYIGAMPCKTHRCRSIINKLFFVLTGNCLNVPSVTPCDVYKLGKTCIQGGALGFTTPSTHRWNLGERIADRVGLRTFTSRDSGTLCPGDYEEEREDHGIPQPIVTIYIYCAPCVCQIQTAFDICRGSGISPLLSFSIRVDDRIPAGCCSVATGIYGLVSINDKLREIDHSQPYQLKSSSFDMYQIDRPWIERRIYEADKEIYRTAYSNNPARNVNRIICEISEDNAYSQATAVILAEVEPCTLMVESIPSAQEARRRPKETDILELRPPRNPADWCEHWQRLYVGSYSPGKPTAGTPPITSPSGSESSDRATQYTSTSPPRSLQQTSASSSPRVKRRKTSSVIEGSNG